MATVNNYQVFAGEDLTFTALPAPGTSGLIAGWNLLYSIRAGLRPTDPVLITKTMANGITLVNVATGNFTIVVTDADLLALGPGLYRWDVWRIDPGFQTCLAYGRLSVMNAARLAV